MSKLLIIHKRQFGDHTGNFKICKNLQEEFSITFLCFDTGLPRRQLDGVKVIYIPTEGNYLKRGFRFIKACIKEVRKDYDYRYLVYFNFCSLIKILTGKKIILDFRTGCVSKSTLKRKLDNWLRRFEASFFNKVTVISEGLRNLLRLPDKKSFILPLGADVLSERNKDFEEPRLLYIGTLNNRNIDQTIIGVNLFLKSNPKYKNWLTYDIVGSGYNNEVQSYSKLVKDLGLEKNITLHGRKPLSKAQPLFDSCNIGVSYIPKTEYYEYQPPTKTFEYVKAGMVCLATSTKENCRYITERNGLLHDDNPEAFAEALGLCIESFPGFDSREIRNTLIDHNWSNIAKKLKSVLQNG